MLKNVIWTSGAAEDFLRADSRLAPTEAIDALVELVRLFPEIGSSVRDSQRLRRGIGGAGRSLRNFLCRRRIMTDRRRIARPASGSPSD